MDWTVERGIILRLQCILMMFVLLLHVEEKTITSFCRQLVASGFVIYIYLLLIHLYIFVAKIIVIDSLNLTLASSNVPHPCTPNLVFSHIFFLVDKLAACAVGRVLLDGYSCRWCEEKRRGWLCLFLSGERSRHVGLCWRRRWCLQHSDSIEKYWSGL